MNAKLIKTLEAEKESLLLRLSLIEQAIRIYSDADESKSKLNNFFSDGGSLVGLQLANNFQFEKYPGYDAGVSTRDKIINIIRAENRFLHVREIAAIAHQFEWHIPVENLIKKISPALSHLKNMPGSWIVSKVVANSHFNTFWGSRDWLDEIGEIKQTYLYSSSQLAGAGKNQFSFL